MNNTTKVLAAVAALAFVVGVFPAAHATANANFGTQVTKTSREFTPTVTDIGAITGIDGFRYDADTADAHYDDVIVLDANNNAGGAADRNDLVLATSGYGTTSLGQLIKTSQNLIAGVSAADASTLTAFYVDLNENTFYDGGDAVILCNGGSVVATTDASGSWCIYLTTYGSHAVGSFVKTGDAVLVGQNSLVTSFGGAAHLVFFASQDSTDFNGLDHPGDQLWLTPVAPSSNNLLPLYSIELFGGTLGHQVMTTDSSFALSIRNTSGGSFSSDPDVFRCSASTSTNLFDDVIILDADNSGDVGQNDIVLASAGYQGTHPGQLITDAMTALIQNCNSASGNQIDTQSFDEGYGVDVNQNNKYDSGDGVLFGPDCSTGTADTSTWCIYLTKMGTHMPGTFVRTGDDVLVGSKSLVGVPSGSVDVDDDGQLLWFDSANTDNTFDPTEHPADRLWFDVPDWASDKDTLPAYAIEIYGGTFGHQVQPSDSDFTLTTHQNGADNNIDLNGITWFRNDAATSDNFFDDQIILDTSNTGSSAPVQDDLVVASSGYQGKQVGDLIKTSDTVLTTATYGACSSSQQTCAGADVFLYVIDANENNVYDTSDGVIMCDQSGLTTASAFATTSSNWCIYLTKFGSKNPGDFVRVGDDVVTGASQLPGNPGGVAGNLNDGVNDLGEFIWFDCQNNNEFLAIEDGCDFAWIDPMHVGGVTYPPLFSLRAYGDFSNVPGGGGNPNVSSTSTSSTSTSGTSTTSTSTTGTSMTSTSSSMTSTSGTMTSGTSEVVNPGQTTTTTTPGLELVALVGALGAALVLVRRKL